MPISLQTSQKIKNMGIVCAMLVVLIHVPFPDSDIGKIVNLLLVEGIASVAVPVFFTVSGYFLAGHFEEEGWYGREVRKRIVSLLLPFVIWTVIAIIVAIPPSIIADWLAKRPMGASPALMFADGQWTRNFGLDLRQGPAMIGALWYVRCLFFFVLAAPLFKLLVKRLGAWWLPIAFMITLYHRSSCWSTLFSLHQIFDLGFSLSGVFYFSAGIWLRIMGIDLFVPRWLAHVCAIVSLLLVCASTALDCCGLKPKLHLITLAIPFMLVSLWSVVPDARWPVWLTASSFPLFLMHMPLIRCFSLPLKYTFVTGSLFGTLVVMICSVIISFIITVILRNHCPRVAGWIFAGRA